MERIKHAALLHKRTAAPNCTPGTCNLENFTVLKPFDWTEGHVTDIRALTLDSDTPQISNYP
jgi:hypothetical protein